MYMFDHNHYLNLNDNHLNKLKNPIWNLFILIPFVSLFLHIIMYHYSNLFNVQDNY